METRDTVIDYMVLVNREHMLPENWGASIASHLVHVSNHVQEGGVFSLEKETYRHFEALRAHLLANGVQIEILSGIRTAEEQLALFQELKEQVDEEYAQSYVAMPGHSEHQTGLALDSAVVLDGQIIDANDDMLVQSKIYETIENALPDFGFILRYPKKKENITGYNSECWHYRYVGSADIAHKIMDNNLTLEEYMGAQGDDE
jgi:D-alanyl-D-alanine carboxypeptidase